MRYEETPSRTDDCQIFPRSEKRIAGLTQGKETKEEGKGGRCLPSESLESRVGLVGLVCWLSEPLMVEDVLPFQGIS